MLRYLLLVMLVFSLVPSVGEVVEMVVHRAVEGHWAHSVPHGDELPGDGEHGCSPMAHLCHCCPSVIGERYAGGTSAIAQQPHRFLAGRGPESPPDVSIEPQLRPPIA